MSDGINVAKRAKTRIFVLMLFKPTAWNSREIVCSQEYCLRGLGFIQHYYRLLRPWR